MIQISLFEDTLEEKLMEAIIEDLKRGSGFSDGKKRIKAMTIIELEEGLHGDR